MIKKLLLSFSIALSAIIAFSQNQVAKNSEKIFLDNADKCLVIMEQAAQKISIKGVAIVAFIPGDSTITWISKMKIVGAISNGSDNRLAIAYTKAAEMATTYQNSGSGIRKPLFGEYGYPGGVIRKVKSGYILAAFSGATGEQDLVASNAGIEWLFSQF